jgi:phage repressor protein C with HTH and peptisase S24 domain
MMNRHRWWLYKPELKGCSRHNLAALKVGGDSMEPTMTKSSIVIVDLSGKTQIGGKVFVVNTPESGIDMVSIKSVRKWEKGFVLLGDNPNYPPVLSALGWNWLCVCGSLGCGGAGLLSDRHITM